MKILKQIPKGIILLLISLSFPLLTGCAQNVKLDQASGAVKKLSELEKYQEQIEKLKELSGKKKDEKAPKTKKIGFIPFEYTVETGPEKADQLLNSMATRMIMRKSFHPASLVEWLKEEINKRTAGNIQQLIARARDTEIQLDYICHGRVFKSGPSYGAIVSVYPIKPDGEPSYYYRSFANYNAILSVANEIVDEMEKRAASTTKPWLNKSIFIKKFNTNFFTYTNIRSGEGSIIKIPYLNVAGTSYKSDEYFVHQVLMYNIHTSRVFRVWDSCIKGSIIDNADIPEGADYIVNADLDISQVISVLTFTVTNQMGAVLFKYKYPFKSLFVDALFKAMRENAKYIILQLLNDNERNRVGVARLSEIDKRMPVYCENFYLGNGKQYDLVLPIGNSDITVASDKYKIFVSSFAQNNKIFRLSDSFLLDLKK